MDAGIVPISGLRKPTRTEEAPVGPVVLLVREREMGGLALRLCDSTQGFRDQRDYLAATCRAKGRTFTVVSRKAGVSVSKEFLQHLIHLGARAIISAGFCKTMRPGSLKTGTVVAPLSTVGDPEETSFYGTVCIPATATPYLFKNFLKAGQAEEIPVAKGICLSTGSYPLGGASLQRHLNAWKGKADVAEGGLHTLYRLRARSGILCAGIMTISGSPFELVTAEDRAAFQAGIRNMLQVAISVSADLTEELEDGYVWRD